MGLEDAEVVDYGGKIASSIPCSICLEDVTDFGDRALAKLHCGHQFHLDCIGSAFNAKGVMQCPNCRKIEKGQWLYADGGKPYPELHIYDIVNDEDLYELTYSETSMWCPYDSFAQLTADFDDVEFPTTAYHDVVGQHAVVSEHATPVSSSATHICPYIAYVQPIHPSTSTANVAEGPRYNNINNNNTSQWNLQSALGENPNSYGLQYHTIPTPTGRIGDLSIPYRPQRTNADMSRSGAYAHPVFATQSSARPPSSSMNRGYPGSGARAGECSQPYLQQTVRAPTGAGPWLNAQLQAGAPSDHYYVSASGSSTGRSFQEAESPMMNLFHHIWESDPPHQHPVERVPYPFHQAGGDGGGAVGFRQGHGLQSHNQYWL